MPNKLLLNILSSLGLALGLAATSRTAEAGWVEGVSKYNSTQCYVSGSLIWAYAAQSYVGYWSDSTMPNQNGVSYVHAVAWNVSGGCVSDTIGFDFFLPPGASLAIDATHPVYCFRGTSPTNYQALTNCSQTPQTGNFGGYFFGWATVSGSTSTAPGQFYEVQVPVRFTQGGPQTVSAGVRSAWGDLNPSINVPVPSPVAFSSFTASSNDQGTMSLVAFDLAQNNIAGQLAVEYGTSPSLGSATAPFALPAQGATHQLVLFGTSPGTKYYWRVRFTTSTGTTLYSAVQEFTTTAVLAPINPLPYPCRRLGC